MKKPKYLNKIGGVEGPSDKDLPLLKKVSEKFAFFSNTYYLSLIDWEDADDPIHRLIIPDEQELEKWGKIDPSLEENYTVMPGLQHKYSSTALLLVSNVCGGICRYCFRKRIFFRRHSDILRDVPAAMKYIREHKEITNVLLTGGDPLMLSTSKLENMIRQLFQIEHVRIVRIGTKLLSFNPYRILGDNSLLEMIKKYTDKRKKIYVVCHYSHPNEMTDVSVEAATRLRESGAILINQTPLIRGVNDNSQVLADLFQRLANIGVSPYYLFQCRPSIGNKAYAVPLEEGYEIFEKSKTIISGLAKRARYVMSHSTGKIEVVGMTESRLFLKYHQASNENHNGSFIIVQRNPTGYWLEDYLGAVEKHPGYSATDETYMNEMALIS